MVSGATGEKLMWCQRRRCGSWCGCACGAWRRRAARVRTTCVPRAPPASRARTAQPRQGLLTPLCFPLSLPSPLTYQSSLLSPLSSLLSPLSSLLSPLSSLLPPLSSLLSHLSCPFLSLPSLLYPLSSLKDFCVSLQSCILRKGERLTVCDPGPRRTGRPRRRPTGGGWRPTTRTWTPRATAAATARRRRPTSSPFGRALHKYPFPVSVTPIVPTRNAFLFS